MKKDQRLLVLLYIALLISLVHAIKNKQHKEAVPETDRCFVWISAQTNKGIYALPTSGITYERLASHFDFSSPDPTSKKIFVPAARQSFSLTPQGIQKQPKVNFLAAPFFLRPIPLNEADASMLTIVPGIGPKLAEKIISKRDETGKFKEVDELLEVGGVGDKKLEALKKYVTVYE